MEFELTKPQKAGFSAKRLLRINELVKGYIDRGELPGILTLISRHGKIIHLEKFGWMDVEAKKPLEFDTIFRIASMTKPITSVAAMMLYERGHFNLNTSVWKFLPDFRHTKVYLRETESGVETVELTQDITMRHLFTHTSGLSYGFNPEDPIDKIYQQAGKELQEEGLPLTNKTLYAGLARMPLAFQPGTKWRYGFNIEILGHIIEVISGLSLDEYLRKRIFEPLEMVDTGFYVPPEKLDRVPCVYGHPKDPSLLEKLDIDVETVPPTYLPGGTGLVSTLADYSNFARMLVNGGEFNGKRLLSPHTVALFSLNHAPIQSLPYGFSENDLYHAGYGYSLGTRVLMDVSKTGMAGSVGEFGWDGAFSTYFWIDPSEDLYGILMTQHSPNAYYPIHQQFKMLTYQALVE